MDLGCDRWNLRSLQNISVSLFLYFNALGIPADTADYAE
jgi:hypothetical protein